MVIDVHKNILLTESLFGFGKKKDEKKDSAEKKDDYSGKKITKIDVTSPNKSIFDKLYNNEALTAEGITIDGEEALERVNKWFREASKCDASNINLYYFTGKVMNSMYHLTGDNKYPDNYHIASIDWIEAKVKDPYKGSWRWFSDVVDNNARREIYKKNPYYKHYHSMYYGNVGWGD